ncbi:CsgG/HfaB family protein [Candidatus Kuenenia sp.]|uniref:CsgG/HfaB family protein n=1 Tax=Candidatus Kuenenia sp. TaxID=2499824 RepID=UPI00322078CF
MKRLTIMKIFFLGCALAFLMQTRAFAEIETIGIATVRPTQAIIDGANRSGSRLSLDRVIQSMNGQLADRINATRKFQIVARNDLDDIVKEQEFAHSGNVSADDRTAAKQFKISGIKYLLVATIDDFQDYNELATFKKTERTATKRVIRLSCIGKIYDATTGKLLESANFQISNKDIYENKTYSTRDGDLNEALLVEIARKMADKITHRVTDVIFPPKVINKRDNRITINRGDGTDIASGQIWDIFAVGDELIDPDTNESLGREEILVGKVKIVNILPKVSTAEIIEDHGIDKGAIVRMAQ